MLVRNEPQHEPHDGGWDKRVETWDAVAASGAFRHLAREVIATAKPQRDDRVVDLGAGTGLLALELATGVEHVTAVDASAAMLDRLAEKAQANGLDNVATTHADLRELPLEDESVTLAVSNYAFHHLNDDAKELALAEARRVLKPGGRLVVCDMMFAISLDPRDRRLIAEKIVSIGRRGPAGFLRLGRNALRLAAGTWEKPAPVDAWQAMLARRKFTDISVRTLEHESGLATGSRPRVRAERAAAIALAHTAVLSAGCVQATRYPLRV